MTLELFALVADTGTVIVDAEVTATELDALVIEVADDDDDADEWGLLGPEELLDEATITYSVEVIVAALVVVGQLTGSVALRKVVVEPVAAVVAGLVVTVESKPFTCSSNDSSVFVDLSAVVLADVLVVVHFITGRGLLVTLLELLLPPLLRLLL